MLESEFIRFVKRGIVILSMLVTFSVASVAENVDWCFTHFTSENCGLSFDNVNAITQDSNGFVWVSTEDGLNRFDGSGFIAYYREQLGLNTDFITALCPDNEGNVWIGTDAGATFYSYADDSFHPLDKLSDNGVNIDNKVTHICIDKNGIVWLSVNGRGLFSYDRGSGSLKNYFSDNGKSTLVSNIRSFLIDSGGDFWFSLYFADLWHSDGTLERMEKVNLKGWKTNDDIMSMVQNPVDNTVYLAAWQNGLCQADLRTGTFKTLIANDEGFRPTYLSLDNDKGVWLATTGGLYRYDAVTGVVRKFSHSIDNRYSLADDSVKAVYCDRSNGLWVGTLSSGINWSAAFQRNFNRYYEADGESLMGGYVVDMDIDGTGKLWAVSEKKGLLYMGRDGMLHKCKSAELPESIVSICSDGDWLWLGSWAGIFRFDVKTGNVKSYGRGLNTGWKDNKVHKLFKTSSGEILAGTTLGMIKYDKSSDHFRPLPIFSGIYVTDMAEALDGTLWVASYADGICRYSMKEDRMLSHYDYKESDHRHLPADKVMSLYIDRDGELWAGSYGGGLMLYDKENDRFSTFRSTELKNNRIAYSMIRDEDGRMWVATSNGLTSFSMPFSEVRYYTADDGLLDEIVDGNSAVRTPDGNIWFSSHNGIVGFNPRLFHTDGKVPPIVLTGFYVNGKKVNPGENEPIKVNVNEVRKMTLTHKQNNFGFSMGLLGFSSPATNALYYMLEGYDDDWHRLDGGTTFSYQNIPAGKYVLRIKGIDGNGIWNETHHPLAITVKAVFYKSTTAYLIYICLIIILMAVLAHYSSDLAVKRERAIAEKAKRAREEELFHEKMDFFTNIIHEIKTPLTLIKTPLQNIMATGGISGEVKDDLNVISNSTDYLDKLVKELLEFIRIEEHGWVMEWKHVDIVERIGFLYYNFKETARGRNLKMTFKHTDNALIINADDTALIKILNNLLSNAMKYAETFVTIEVDDSGDGYVTVSFKNDGPKIPDERKEEIFKPFIQYSDERSPYSQSFGIGLPLARTLAELHGGTLTLKNEDITDFVLRLPKGETDAELEVQDTSSNADQNEEADSSLSTLLIVEDNAELSSYLVRKLGHDFNAVSVPSAERAMSMIAGGDVDMVLSDIALEGMSGIELCSKVTADISTSHIPVVMLSALSSPEVKVKCMEAGASLYIEKPFNLEYLVESLKVIARKRESLKIAHLSGIAGDDKDKFALTDSDAVFLQRLEKAVTENISDTEFGPDELAEAALVSRSTLVRKMKSLLNMTPNDYIKVRRLNAAAAMIENGASRINDVCYAVGFNTPSYFAKCFKKQFGVLPADYMKKS